MLFRLNQVQPLAPAGENIWTRFDFGTFSHYAVFQQVTWPLTKSFEIYQSYTTGGICKRESAEQVSQADIHE